MENLKLIVYGSLINQKSLHKSLKYQKVWVHGYKRIFDLKSVKHLYESWETDVAVLNVKKCKTAKFNALLYKISPSQLHELFKREKTYKLIKVKYSDYNKVEGEAFLFIGLEQSIHKNLNPDSHYFHICRKGAYSISRKFGEDWDNTTYLANGKKVSELGKHLIKLNKYNKIDVPYQDK